MFRRLSLRVPRSATHSNRTIHNQTPSVPGTAGFPGPRERDSTGTSTITQHLHGFHQLRGYNPFMHGLAHGHTKEPHICQSTILAGSTFLIREVSWRSFHHRAAAVLFREKARKDSGGNDGGEINKPSRSGTTSGQWTDDTLLIDVLRANEMLRPDFPEDSQGRPATLSYWGDQADDKQAKHDILDNAFPNIVSKLRESTLRLCISALDNAVQTLQEKGKREENRKVETAIDEVVQSGVQLEEALLKHMNQGTRLLSSEHNFRRATVAWIETWGIVAKSAHHESTIAKLVSDFYNVCYRVWINGNSLSIDRCPSLSSLMEKVIQRLPSALENSKSEEKSLPTLEALRSNHLDSATEKKMLAHFAKDAPRHQAGWLPVHSATVKFEPEFMCAFDHLQFTKNELPESRYLDLTEKCSVFPSSRTPYMVLAPSATGKTGTAMRTLCKRGGWYIDFHGTNGRSQFYQNKSFSLAKTNFKFSSPAFLMGHVYVWLLSHVLYTALLRQSLGDLATASDMTRAQLNGHREVMAAIYDILVNDLKLYMYSSEELTRLVDDAIIASRPQVKNKSVCEYFDTFVFDEAQVIKDQELDEFLGAYYSHRGTKRGMLTVILRAISTLENLQNLFVMGTSHSIDLSALLESSVGKQFRWESADPIPILAHHFIRTRRDLAQVLRSMLNAEKDCGHYIDLAVGREEIGKILPLRGRVLSVFLNHLSRMVSEKKGWDRSNNKKKKNKTIQTDEQQSLQERELLMSDMLFKSLMAAYDQICMQIFARLVGDPGKARSKIPFTVEDLNENFGKSVDVLFQKHGTALTSSLYSIVAHSVQGSDIVTLHRSSQSLSGGTGAEQMVGHDMKDWLSVGLVGAEAIELDPDANPKSITYRVDEPLTQRVCRMLLQIAHHRSCQPSVDQKVDINPDFQAYSAIQILRQCGKESNPNREMALGLMFCRSTFQGQPLSKLPFIKDVSVKISSDGNDPDWLSEVRYSCTDYVLLDQLVPSLPLDGMSVVLSKHLSNGDLLKTRLSALGARVLERVTEGITHYVCSADMSVKGSSEKERRQNAVDRGALLVSNEWVDRCYESLVAIKEDMFLINPRSTAQRRTDRPELESHNSNSSSSSSSSKREWMRESERARMSRLASILKINPDLVVGKCIKLGNHAHPDFLIVLRDDRGRLFAIVISQKVHESDFRSIEKKSLRSTDLRLLFQNNYLKLSSEDLDQYPFKDMEDMREFNDLFHGCIRVVVHISKTDSVRQSSVEGWTEKANMELQDKDILRIVASKDLETLVPREVVADMFT